MNDPKVGVAKVTCPTFEAMGQIPAATASTEHAYWLALAFVA